MTVETLIAWKSVALLCVFALCFTLERWLPRAPRPATHDRLWRNAGLWAVNLPVSPLVVVPLTVLATQLDLWTRPDWWSGGWSIVIDVLLLDLWIYWMHRAFHEVPFLWRFHAIHHHDEHLDSTSAMRFHFGEIILSASVRMGIVIALDIPLTSVLVFETVAMMAAIFQHSNIALPRWLERPLSWVIVTPSIHWVHHHTPREDTNSNYCNIFSWWDILFASRSPTARWPEMPIGLAEAGDRPLKSLMVQPFMKRDSQ